MQTIINAATPSPKVRTYNAQQAAAIAGILTWLDEPREGSPHFYLLEGFAGTGKTFCMQALVKAFKSRIIFTAPTNKATKVLRDVLQTDLYKPECRTIYSLLGLGMSTDGEIKEIKTPEKPLDLSQFRCIVVDEGSMINSQLFGLIKTAAKAQGLRFLFLGDSAQLPPVGERSSEIWTIPQKSSLTEVMRHDNEILTLATAIRMKVDHPAPTVKILTANSNNEGVWKLPNLPTFLDEVRAAARGGLFQAPGKAKAIAWRNATVNDLNAIIRRTIFDHDSAVGQWVESDRVLFLEPAKDLDDDVIATTDDEGLITRVREAYHPTWPEFEVYELSITLDTGAPVLARVLHPRSQSMFAAKKSAMADRARIDRRQWKNFWEFSSAFHNVRHAYAITAHRSQGSTYETTFIHAQDILSNMHRNEAYRCLYVACTRASKREFIL